MLAERSLRAAVNVLRPIAESRGQPKYARNLAIACNNLSFVLRSRDAEAAEGAAREATTILERLVRNIRPRCNTRMIWPCVTTTWRAQVINSG
jgi:hypothetical protein